MNIPKLMTWLIWGPEVAKSGWTDPDFPKVTEGQILAQRSAEIAMNRAIQQLQEYITKPYYVRNKN